RVRLPLTWPVRIVVFVVGLVVERRMIGRKILAVVQRRMTRREPVARRGVGLADAFAPAAGLALAAGGAAELVHASDDAAIARTNDARSAALRRITTPRPPRS